MGRGGRNGTSFKQTKSAGAIRRRAKECEGLAGGDGAPGALSPVMGAGENFTKVGGEINIGMRIAAIVELN